MVLPGVKLTFGCPPKIPASYHMDSDRKVATALGSGKLRGQALRRTHWLR